MLTLVNIFLFSQRLYQSILRSLQLKAVAFGSCSAKDQNSVTLVSRARSTELLVLLYFNCSGLGLDSAGPVSLGIQTAIKRLDCASIVLIKPRVQAEARSNIYLLTQCNPLFTFVSSLLLLRFATQGSRWKLLLLISTVCFSLRLGSE
jgi:hypothetical protein